MIKWLLYQGMTNMTTAQRQQLQVMVDLAQEQVDAAQKKLAHCLAHQRQQHDKLQLLEQYRGEYEQQMMTLLQGGAQIHQLHSRTQFMQKIEQAVVQQTQATQLAAQQVAHAQTLLNAAVKRQQGFLTLQKKRQLEWQAKENKREQRDNDEYAQRSYARQQAQISESY
jgi:flagellar FliJ protein